MTITTDSATAISDMSDADLYGEAVFGDNGDTNGVPTHDCGHDSTAAVFGYNVWSSDMTSGLDSGDKDFELDVNPGGGTGGLQCTVEGDTSGPLVYEGVTYGAIQKVEIRAFVTLAGCRMSWSGVTVKFYKGGTLIEQGNASPVADATNDADPTAREQVTTLTPANTDNDQVVIAGSVRLQANAGITPGATDLSAQVFVYVDGLTPV